MTAYFSADKSTWTTIGSRTDCGFLSDNFKLAIASQGTTSGSITYSDVTVNDKEVKLVEDAVKATASNVEVTYDEDANSLTAAGDTTGQDVIVKWAAADEEDGNYSIISGAEGTSLTASKAMKGKYVKAAYVPLIGTGAAGDIVWSDAVHVTGNGTDSGAAAVKSANAELATADITTGENTALFQFVKGTSFYQTTAGSDVQQIRYSFAAEDAKATVKVVVNGTETEELSGSAVLTNGRNLIEVKVTAEDGVTVERYRFTISRQGENNALLESLQVNGQAIELTEGVYEYSLPLATGTTTAQVAATAQSTRASVSIVNGTKVTSAVQTVQSDVTVEPGTNEITIRVTPETSAGPVYYKLKLKVPNASNARLEALNFGENVSLAEKFDADTFNYTASATESGVTISATAEEADAIVNVIWKDTVIQTGTGSAATELGLTEGDNTVKVRVTSADGSTEKIYTVTVHASGETWLSDLDWESQTSGDSGNPTRKDKSCGNNTLTLWDGSAEETFEKGIGSHADSTIIYDLTGKGYTSFSSYYGVDRETKVNPSQASITFKVYVDGNLKFTSAEMGTNTAKGFTGDIDITGATELKLVMEKGTNNWSDHGDWANAKLTKPFTAPQSFAVTVRANDPAMGSAAADQNEYQKYDTATVTATANEGYHFVNWTNAEGTVVSESNPYVFGVTEDVTLTANFEADPVTKYTLATEVNDAVMGSVTVTPSQSEYDENSSVTVTAVPASDDYEFVNWTNPDTNAEVSTEAEYTFEITGNTKLKANFREKEKSYHVQAESADEVMGTVSVAPETSGNVYVKDTEVTVTATPNAGYEFVQWNKITDNNGTEVSEKVEGAEVAYTFAVTEDVHLRAEFRLIPVVKNQYRVTVTSSDTAMGTVSMDHEDGVYEDGEDVTVTATAAEGYHFVGWKLKDSEDILSTDAKYIFTISENVELIGVFEKDEEPEQVITAEEIVRQIVADKSFATSVKKGTKKLTLPGVPENAQIEISSVNPEGIIALNGEVTAPKADTEVIVTVKVTGTDGSVSYADFKVMVEGSGEQENPDPEKPDNGNNGGNNSDNDNNNNSNAGNNDNNSGNKGDNGNADQRTVKATKTGDTTNFALYGMAMAAAGAVIATLVYRRKRS
ncbi:MAG: InlB B-repeat-containing protein [[Ruminococcus] lactaris]